MVSAGGRSPGAVSSLTRPFNIYIQTASQIRKGLAYGVNSKKRLFSLLEGLYASFPPALCSLTHMMYTYIFPPQPPHTLHLEATMVVAQPDGCL